MLKYSQKHIYEKHIDISTPNVFLTVALLLVPIKKLPEAQELRERGIKGSIY